MRITVTTVGLPLEVERPEQEAMAQEQGDRIEMDLPQGSTVGDILKRIGRQRDQVQEVLVNGNSASADARLKEGDAVALVGQASGM